MSTKPIKPEVTVTHEPKKIPGHDEKVMVKEVRKEYKAQLKFEGEDAKTVVVATKTAREFPNGDFEFRQDTSWIHDSPTGPGKQASATDENGKDINYKYIDCTKAGDYKVITTLKSGVGVTYTSNTEEKVVDVVKDGKETTETVKIRNHRLNVPMRYVNEDGKTVGHDYNIYFNDEGKIVKATRNNIEGGKAEELTGRVRPELKKIFQENRKTFEDARTEVLDQVTAERHSFFLSTNPKIEKQLSELRKAHGLTPPNPAEELATAQMPVIGNFSTPIEPSNKR